MRCMHRTNIYLEVEQCSRLDEQARSRGISRAELIRRLLDRALDLDCTDLAEDVAAIEDSFGALGDESVTETRRRDDRDRYLDGLWRS